MEMFWKAVAGALITSAVGIMLSKHNKEIHLMTILAACIMLASAAIYFFKPVAEFLHELKILGNLRGDILNVLMKCFGIGIVTEISCSICADSGNSSLGKLLSILGSSTILWLSIPVFQAVLELINRILGGI